MKNYLILLFLILIPVASAQNSNITLNRPNSSSEAQQGSVNFTASHILGNYTSAEESTLIGGLGSGDKGSVWFNSTLNSIGLWTGSKVVRFSGFDFGNGSAGVQTITGTTTLTTDGYYTNLTISSTGTLLTRGYRIFVNGTLTINSGGVIHNDGPNGASATTQTGAAAGTGVAGVYIGGSINPGGGATGVAGVGAQANNISNNANCGGNGGNGGAGGSGGSGAGGTARTNNKTVRIIQYPTYDYVVGTTLLLGGASGVGGSSGAGDGTNLGRGGGAGGAGGGMIAIFANQIINNGTIRSNGGNGGNGANATVGNVGGGGGGAGGGGGCIYLYYSSYSGSGSLLVNGGTGGTGGTGFGTGVAGGNGGNGTSGTIYRYNVVTQTWD